MGFDAGAQVYTTAWMESISTALAIARGRFDEQSKTFHLVGRAYDPLLGRYKDTTTDIAIISPDRYKVIMIDTAPSGEIFRSLEIQYRRKK
jgi:hypothetical protein